MKTSTLIQSQCPGLMLPLFLFTMAVLLLAAPCYGAADTEREEEYEMRTEISLSGTIVDIPDGHRGRIWFLLEASGRIYEVLAGPRWYLEQQGLTLREGMKVSVTGSKFYNRKGTLSLVLYRLDDLETGMAYFFRDEHMRPKWRGRHRGGMHP